MSETLIRLDKVYPLCEQFNSQVIVCLEDNDGYQEVISGEDGYYLDIAEMNQYMVFGIQALPFGSIQLLVRKIETERTE